MSIVKIGMDNSAMKVKLEDAGILDACVYGNTLIIVINNRTSNRKSKIKVT